VWAGLLCMSVRHWQAHPPEAMLSWGAHDQGICMKLIQVPSLDPPPPGGLISGRRLLPLGGYGIGDLDVFVGTKGSGPGRHALDASSAAEAGYGKVPKDYLED